MNLNTILVFLGLVAAFSTLRGIWLPGTRLAEVTGIHSTVLARLVCGISSPLLFWALITFLSSYGDAVTYIGAVPKELQKVSREATSANPSIGFIYKTHALWGFDISTSNGRYCLYDGPKYWPIADAEIDKFISTDSRRTPLSYAAPSGLVILLTIAIGTFLNDMIGHLEDVSNSTPDSLDAPNPWAGDSTTSEQSAQSQSEANEAPQSAEDLSEFLDSLQPPLSTDHAQELQAQRALTRQTRFRREIVVSIVSISGAWSTLGYYSSTGVEPSTVVVQAVAVLIGGPFAGAVLGALVYALAILHEAKEEMSTGQVGASILPHSPWDAFRLFMFAGPTLVGAVIASESGWAGGALPACILLGTMVTALFFRFSGYLLGYNRILS